LEHFAEWFEPDEFLFGDATPEFFRLLDRFVVELAIVRHRFDARSGGKFFFGREDPGFVEHGGDVCSGCVGVDFIHKATEILTILSGGGEARQSRVWFGIDKMRVIYYRAVA
jgi:hypothetical protein